MGPVQAADAAARSRARHVIPVHYGTLHPTGWPSSRLDWTTDPGHRFLEVLPQWSDATAHVPPVGGAVMIPPERAALR
jgi:L-ascorbate metabolism protein UlaG (beta-lactamase superfamily)